MNDTHDNTKEEILSPSTNTEIKHKSRLAVTASILAFILALCMLGTLTHGFLVNTVTSLYMFATGFLTLILGSLAIILAVVARKHILRSQGRLDGSRFVHFTLLTVFTVIIIGVIWGVVEWMQSSPNRMVAKAMQSSNLQDKTDYMCKAFALNGVSERFVLQASTLENLVTQQGKPEFGERINKAIRDAYEDRRIIPMREDSIVFWMLRGKPSPPI